MITIGPFNGRYAFLSNHYPVTIEFDGNEYKSVEHAYQASKTNDPHKRARIRAAATPKLAQEMGNWLRALPGWGPDRLETMRALLEDKFSYEHLANMLLETGDAKLININTWGDVFWGVFEPPRGAPSGANRLGKMLMEIRAEIRSEK